MLTFGHGAASAEELAALIRNAGIETVVDVRRFPGSRRHPHFARSELERWMPSLAGASYRWEPELGGFRKPRADSRNVALRNPSFRAFADYMETPEFAAALTTLVEQSATTQAAIMCSESLWWRCHRRLISDALTLLAGVDVSHLDHAGKLHSHALTDGVRRIDRTTLRYDALPLFGAETKEPLI